VIKILAGILASGIFLVIGTYLVDLIIKAPTYRGPESDHFDGTRFHNPDGSKARGLVDVLKWALTEDPGPWEHKLPEGTSPGPPPRPTVSDDTIRITFVNHATFLIQTGGINILTDPIWSERASPFQWIGPKRMRPPGIRFEDLPQIDLVLISHNHYDHLDIHTVKRLNKKFNPLFITPLGVSLYLRKNGIENTTVLDWWNHQSISNKVKVSAVPAQHFSGRGLSDRDQTLWCGFVVETPSGNIYFAGDTGYDGFFKKIGQRFSPIEIALIPIGAYQPRWFMKPIHVNPEEAVLIHKDVNATRSIGMHFGSFPLADDGMQEPVQDLKKAREKFNVPAIQFLILQEGMSKTFSLQPAPVNLN